MPLCFSERGARFWRAAFFGFDSAPVVFIMGIENIYSTTTLILLWFLWWWLWW